MLIRKNCEMFYTAAVGSNEDEALVDQVSIDEVNKEYLLDSYILFVEELLTHL